MTPRLFCFAQLFSAGFCLFCILTQAQLVEPASCLQLEGLLIDLATQQPVSDAQLFAKLPSGRIKLMRTTNSGTFSAKVPCGATAIFIDKPGYRSQIMQLNQVKAETIHVLIPLLAIEGQSSDRPYLQTEQTDFVHQNSVAGTERLDSLTMQHGLFMITDAIHNKPLKADVCFFFTKSGKKTCAKTDSQGHLQFDFVQADIIAVEITASGYQKYAGNLIVSLLDGRLLQHEIKLQRELTVLSVRTDRAKQCELRSNNKVIKLTNLPGSPGWFSTYDALPKRYVLVVTNQNGITQQSIELSSGFNYASITKPIFSSPKTAPKNATETGELLLSGLIRPDSIPMIYFEQGSYQLRSDSQEVLKQVANYLRTHQRC